MSIYGLKSIRYINWKVWLYTNIYDRFRCWIWNLFHSWDMILGYFYSCLPSCLTCNIFPYTMSKHWISSIYTCTIKLQTKCFYTSKYVTCSIRKINRWKDPLPFRTKTIYIPKFLVWYMSRHDCIDSKSRLPMIL